jgi:hypothetical protein
MNDIRRDWRRWSRIEQIGVTLAAVISLVMVAIGLA